MDDIRSPAATSAAGPPEASALRPRGLVDLRGLRGEPFVLSYPAGAVVVVSGLPGSGKSTLLHRLSAAAPAVDPRTVHVACEAVMPAWLPYAVYRPWARIEHVRWLRAQVRAGGPFLVHDCGSRPWLRRWLSRAAGRQGRALHLVLLDVTPDEALAGQRARGRRASRRVFLRHRQGLERLLGRLPTPGAVPEGRAVPSPVAEAASVVLLDGVSRERVVTAAFGDDGARAVARPPAGPVRRWLSGR
ncbi:AAA family ATPase [Streptomyces sp. NPDC049555]|uniref:AAA family ATPase n=1 Tax=Streptomyces sp. NPDC049555 TaxID=3154930 RepID=UPI00341B1152